VNSDPTSTWVAGHNKNFDDMSYSAIRGMLGALEEPDWMKLPETDL